MKKSTRTPITPADVEPAGISLHGKLALITGATQGIGLAIARSLAAEGCDLILCARNRQRLLTARSQLLHNSVQVTTFACDVRQEKSVASMFVAIRKKFSHLDILVNSAGIAHPFRLLTELKTEEWNNVLATNLTGTFLVSRGALPLMSRGTSIVNVLSMSSKRAFPNLAAYTASKFGALGLTNAIREELRSQGIRVIAALPGSTDTPIWETLWPEAPRSKMMRPETVAQAIVATLRLPPETTVEELHLMPTGGPL